MASASSIALSVALRVADPTQVQRTAAQYLSFVTMAVNDLSGVWLLPKTEDTSITLATSTYNYDVPSGFAYIHQLIVADSDDQYPASNVVPHHMWEIRSVSGAPEIQFWKDFHNLDVGRKLKVIGQKRFSTTIDGSSTIPAGSETFIRERAAAYAFESLAAGSDELAQRRARSAEQAWAKSEEEKKRIPMQFRLLPDSIIVPDPLTTLSDSSIVSNTTIIIGSILYPATRAGIQAAHDALPNGGTIVIPNYTPITTDGITLTLTNANIHIQWPKSSPFKLPTGTNVCKPLIRIGPALSSTNFTTASFITGARVIGDRWVVVASLTGADLTPGATYAIGDYVYIYQGGRVSFNRIEDINTSSSVLYLEYPLSVNLDSIGTTPDVSATVVRYSGVTRKISIDGLHIDNNGNTFSGVQNGFTAVASTTTTAVVNPTQIGQYDLVVASSAAFSASGYVLIDNQGRTQLGESKGWLVQYTSKPSGTTLRLVAPPPYGVASGVTVQEVSTSDIKAQAGIVLINAVDCSLTNISAENLWGSMIFSYVSGENTFRNVQPRNCGATYAGTITGGFYSNLHSAEWHYEVGSDISNSWTRSANSRGFYMLLCNSIHADGGSTGARSRGVTIDSCSHGQFNVSALNGWSTGIALSGNNHYCIVKGTAIGNRGNGFWTSNEGSVYNIIDVVAQNNNWGAGENGDFIISALDLHNQVRIGNIRHNNIVIIDSPGALGVSYFGVTGGTPVANTVAETALATGMTGKGSLTTPANRLRVGDVIDIHAAGVFSNTATPTIRFRLRMVDSAAANVVVCDGGAVTTTVGAGNSLWWFDGSLTVREVGTVNSIEAKGVFSMIVGTTLVVAPCVTSGLFNVNTALANEIRPTIEWGTADALNTLSATKLNMELRERSRP